MRIKENEFVLYGLSRYAETIDTIINEIDNVVTVDNCFDIKLILTEALTNAFKHGNNSDKSKPIYLRYIYNGTIIKIEVEDSGYGSQNISIPEAISDDALLQCAGRGLFLIKSLADNVELKRNTLIIEKNIAKV